MKKKIKRILSAVLVFSIMICSVAPSYAMETKVENTIEPRFSWIYSEVPPNGVTFESSYYDIKDGSNKLNQTLGNIALGTLAGYLVSFLKVNVLAQAVAGSIISNLPSAYSGSDTLYYLCYEYHATGAMKTFYKKCVVYVYYDKNMTDLVEKVTYYGSYC